MARVQLVIPDRDRDRFVAKAGSPVEHIDYLWERVNATGESLKPLSD